MTDQNGMLAGRIWEASESSWAGTTEGSPAPHFPLRAQPPVPIQSGLEHPPLEPALDRQSILSATLRTLMRRYSSPGSQFVSLLAAENWFALPAPLRSRSLHVDDAGETDAVLAWVLQLLSRGQTVILVLEAAHVAQHFARLAADLCRPNHALVLIVHESPPGDSHDPLLRLLQRLPLTVLFPSDWRDARQVVRRKAIGRNGLAVVVARESVGAVAPDGIGSDSTRREGEAVDIAVVTYGPLVNQAEHGPPA